MCGQHVRPDGVGGVVAAIEPGHDFEGRRP